MQEIIDVTFLVTDRLQEIHIPYMISGSVAASFYSVPRMTNDVDIVVQMFKKDKEILLSLFSHDFYISAKSIDDAFAGVGIFNIIHNKSILKCDLILLKNDDFSRSAFDRAVTKKIDQRTLKIISMEDLILQKLLWRKETQSEQQLKDVSNIITQNRNSLNKDYVLHWANELKVLEDVKKILS